MSEKAERRIMTPDERRVYYAMRHTVRFPVASWDKRFFRSLSEMRDTITDKEAPQLWRLAVRYRRQWMRGHNAEDTALLRLSESLAAPDFRKQQAAERAQRIIDDMKKKYSDAMQNKVLDTTPNP